MNEYQRGMYDLGTFLRKHGVVLMGCNNFKRAYHKFLAGHDIKRRNPTKLQRKIFSNGEHA